VKPHFFKPGFLNGILLPLCVACLWGASAPRVAAQVAVTIPDTPAGKQLAAFLTALNTGNRATLRTFAADNTEAPPNTPSYADDFAEQHLRLYGQSHGFVVRKIEQSASAMIKALVQGKSTGAWMAITIFVTAQPPDYVVAAPPYHIVGIGVSDIETPVEFLLPTRLSKSQLRAKIDGLMTALVSADAFSGTLYVAKNGRPIYARAFGLANRTWHAPNRIDTRFNLASITKMFTAVAIAQLVEQGKLSYGDTVGKVLPNYPNKEVAARVTLHHLLSHTSGIIGSRALVEKAPEVATLRTIDEMVKPFVNEPLSFPPGQQFDYSNAGFILLGAIIEKASGQSYYDYVREHIFKPAGMAHTDFYALDTDPPNLATGFMDGPNGTRRDNIFQLGVIGSPAGGAYSTGEDMAKFQMALTNHTLFNVQSLTTLWTGVTEEPERDAEYGYGAYISRYNGTRIVWHGGGWQGITNQFDMYPEAGYTVVVLSNYDDDPAIIANKLREWLTQGTTKELPTPQLPPALTMNAKISATTVTTGRPLTITLMVKNSGGTSHAGIIDMEVKDANGAKANQQFTMGQKIVAGQTRTYSYSWVPTLTGRYTIDIGAFGPGWRSKYRFAMGVATVIVN
jgi:CubicO group peptidase (beta-lactamase class C family)